MKNNRVDEEYWFYSTIDFDDFIDSRLSPVRAKVLRECFSNDNLTYQLNTHEHHLFGLYKSNQIYEGLVKSLNYKLFFEKFLDLITNAGLPQSQLTVNPYPTKGTALLNNIDLKTFEQIKQFLLVSGWYIVIYHFQTATESYPWSKDVSEISELITDNIGKTVLTLELNPLHQIDFVKSPRFIYHVTSEVNVEKIISTGLKPSNTKNSITHYGNNRIYFATDVKKLILNTYSLLVKHSSNKKYVGAVEQVKSFKTNGDLDWYLLIVDTFKFTDNINESIRFFKDPDCGDYGIYTLQNISPFSIVKPAIKLLTPEEYQKDPSLLPKELNFNYAVSEPTVLTGNT